MKSSRRHSYKLPGFHHHFAIPEFDDQLAIHSEKCFVRVGMMVPAELLSHHAHPYLVIVHFAERHICVSFCHGPAKHQGIH
jgi:hypothetical protein